MRKWILAITLFSSYCFPFYACSESNSYITEEIDDSWSRLMIIPDLQNYTHLDERLKYLDSIINYYKTNKNSIDAVFQVGDLTNNNEIWQYENAYNHLFGLFNEHDQVVFCLGNHDYGNSGTSDIRMSNMPDYLMPPYDIKMDGSKWENYVRYITIGDKQFGVLVLEFCTRNETLEWANNVISSDSETPYIILLHVFLDQNGLMFDASDTQVINQGSSHKKYKMGDDYKNDSREIFDKIIYNNPNVKLLFCGHCLTPSFINVLSEKNAIGNDVHMVEVNFQHYNDGGSGFVALFDMNEDTYRIRSYSTYKNVFGDIDISF